MSIPTLSDVEKLVVLVDAGSRKTTGLVLTLGMNALLWSGSRLGGNAPNWTTVYRTVHLIRGPAAPRPHREQRSHRSSSHSTHRTSNIKRNYTSGGQHHLRQCSDAAILAVRLRGTAWSCQGRHQLPIYSPGLTEPRSTLRFGV